MIKIRFANEQDLHNMIDLWGETINWQFNRFPGEEDFFEPTLSYVLQIGDRWQRDIANKHVLVAYDCKDLMGFYVFDWYPMNGKPAECMFLNEMLLSGRNTDEETMSRLVAEVGKLAVEKGCQRMRVGISSERKDDLKERCIRLGAKFADMQGLNYCYYEYYEWRDLRCFLKEK